MSWFSKRPPKFVDTGIRRTQTEFMTRIHSFTGIFPETLDAIFTPISHDWFFNKATQDELRKHFFGLPNYTSEAWDCENFAVELNQWICRKAALAYVPASPCSLTNCVNNKFPWAGVADGYHALNLLDTDKGLFVVEPQSIQKFIVSAPFKDYPNKSFKIYQ